MEQTEMIHQYLQVHHLKLLLQVAAEVEIKKVH
jgi:hypothetical protein